MKLITFTEASRTRIGLLQNQNVVDLSQAAPSLPQDMLSLLQAGDAAMQEAAKHASATAHFSIPDVVIEAPIKRPPKILAISGSGWVRLRSASTRTMPRVGTRSAASFGVCSRR